MRRGLATHHVMIFLLCGCLPAASDRNALSAHAPGEAFVEDDSASLGADISGNTSSGPGPLVDAPSAEAPPPSGDDAAAQTPDPSSDEAPQAPIDPMRPLTGPTVRLQGRFDAADANRILFAFPGSSMITRVLGTGVDIALSDTRTFTYDGNVVHNYYNVFVDGVWHKSFAIEANTTRYAAAQNLPYGDHIVRVSKRTEPQIGTAVFGGFVAAPNSTLRPAPQAAARQIEFIGDSITCGYGADGNVRAGNGCKFSDATENADATYAAQLSESLGAEFVAVAYSGKGMVQNNDCKNDPVNTIPKFYDTIVPLHDPNKWDFSQWTPQVVVINLGTNDYNLQNDCAPPSSASFTNAWTDFLRTVRARYPLATVFCTVGPDLEAPYLSIAEGNIQAAIMPLSRAGDHNIFFVSIPFNDGKIGYGCAGHPNRAQHKLVADTLQKAIKAQMNW